MMSILAQEASPPLDCVADPQVYSLRGKTILQLIPELEAGGAERTTVDMVAAISEVGGRALVASRGGRLVAEIHAKGGVWIPFPAETKNPLKMLLNVVKLMGLIRKEKIDLIHARSRAPAWVAYAVARITGLPFVTTYHGSYSGRTSFKRWYNSVMIRGDAVIANSQYTARLILEQYNHIGGSLHIIPRAVDLRIFSPSTIHPERVLRLREAWGIGPEEKIILLPGRLTPWKGQRVFIDAARYIKQRGYRDIIFIMAGDAQNRKKYVDDLDHQIASYGLIDCIKYVGHCTDMPAAYLASSVIVVPSIEPEAFGRIAIEAQALGTPVVVSDLGATAETVLASPNVSLEDYTGWIVPAGDPEVLAKCLIHVLSLGASDREKLARRARQHIEEQFSLPYMCQKTLAIYQRYV